MAAQRCLSGLIPYRIIRGVVYVYLQRRMQDAPTSPGCLGIFGGGAEEEDRGDPERTLIREIQEELCIFPTNYRSFLVWQNNHKRLHLFVMEVPENWEHLVTVCEGEYGRFYTEEEVLAEPLMTPLIREMLKLFFTALRAHCAQLPP